jgi:hypothetical protein
VKPGSSENPETSFRQVVARIVKTIRRHAVDMELMDERSSIAFENDLAYLIINQIALFNSPVLFNVGIPERNQQVSACYILGAEDNIGHIAENQGRLGHGPVASVARVLHKPYLLCGKWTTEYTMAPKATEETLAEVRDTLLRIETIIQDGLPATVQRLDILIEEVDRVEERLRKIRKKVDEIEPCLEALLRGICGKSCRPPPAASRCYR